MNSFKNCTAEDLRLVVRSGLHGAQIFVVSNREPYLHSRDASGSLTVTTPASGVVTSLDPIMRTCGGVWIAHGSGAADRDSVDHLDHIRVPPADPCYTLRRIWLPKDLEAGYNDGFSIEGLWSLCHSANQAPVFRVQDWHTFAEANAKFAEAVATESHTESPVVLLQDFHLALSPGLIRRKMPDATIVLFWHIPWPDISRIEICPWKQELLQHMINADILGFQTHDHCDDFLSCVEGILECRVDREKLTIENGEHICNVAPYPISIDWPAAWLKGVPEVARCRQTLTERHKIFGCVVGLSIDRWDFTKGILERLRSIELLLDSDPNWCGKLCLLQIVAPSRGHLPAYRDLQRQTYSEVDRVNAKFRRNRWRPVVLIDEYQKPQSIYEYYRAVDFCWINSLDDGMNLVAKEFVASRDDEDGVLILSKFAGASVELVQAVLVDPLDAFQSAMAVKTAATMEPTERRLRMRMLRKTVKENNVFSWAARLFTDTAAVRRNRHIVA